MSSTNSTHAGSHPVHNILITLPRTASNILTQILNLPAQPSIKSHPETGYFFLDPFLHCYHRGLTTKSITEWSNEDQQEVQQKLLARRSALTEYLDTAEQEGKGTFLKEHMTFLIDPTWRLQHEEGSTDEKQPETLPPDNTALNPTVFPPTFWLSKVQPTFLIRHPALVFPSYLRTSLWMQSEYQGDGLMTNRNCTYSFHRKLYTMHVSAPAATRNKSSFVDGVEFPIVLDAEDFAQPALLRKYAEAVGLDPRVVRFAWEPASQAELDGISPVKKRFLDTLLASSSVDPGKIRKMDGFVLGDEKEKWVGEFGEEMAERLAELVEEAMPDYEWLRERRLTL